MIKGAIFDVDGTLLDSMFIWKDVGIRYVRSRGIESEANLSEVLFPMILEEGAAYVMRRYGLKESIEQIVQGILDMVRDFYYYEAQLKDGAKDFLQAMDEKGIPMVVATSSERDQIEHAFKRLEILHYFKRIFTCTEVGVGKRKPVVYKEAEKFLGIEAKEIYVFEDVIHAIRTAKTAGFQTVGLYDSSSEAVQKEIKETADIYLGNLKDFQKFWTYVAKGRER